MLLVSLRFFFQILIVTSIFLITSNILSFSECLLKNYIAIQLVSNENFLDSGQMGRLNWCREATKPQVRARYCALWLCQRSYVPTWPTEGKIVLVYCISYQFYQYNKPLNVSYTTYTVVFYSFWDGNIMKMSVWNWILKVDTINVPQWLF